MRYIGFAAAVVFCCMTQRTAAAPNVINTTSSPIPGRYLVILTPGTSSVQAGPALVNDVGGILIHTFKSTINGFSFFGTSTQASALIGRAGVYEVWEVGRARAFDVQTAPHEGLDRIDQRELPLDGEYSYTSVVNRTTTIYVVDSGIDPTNELRDRVVANVNFYTNPETHVRDPNDYTDYGLPLDDHWHGTASAMVAAGMRAGVAKSANVANVRVLDERGYGSWDDVIAGIEWVTEQALARPSERHVGNLSLGARGTYINVEDAIRKSVAAGVAWAISAGNSGESACDFTPARVSRTLSGAMTVGAMHVDTSEIASYSNQGPCVEIFAPSDMVLALDLLDGRIVGGTSAAAPFVAGTLALRMQSSLVSAAEAEGLVKGYATSDVLLKVGPNTPNLLLYSLAGKRRAAGS